CRAPGLAGAAWPGSPRVYRWPADTVARERTPAVQFCQEVGRDGAPGGVTMPAELAAERLISLFRPRSVALVGASDKSVFSQLAYHNLVRFGFAERTYLVNRRGVQTHGRPTVTSCAAIGEPVDVAYL